MKINFLALFTVAILAEEKGGRIKHEELRPTHGEIIGPDGVTYQKFAQQFEDFKKFD